MFPELWNTTNTHRWRKIETIQLHVQGKAKDIFFYCQIIILKWFRAVLPADVQKPHKKLFYLLSDGNNVKSENRA